MTVSSPSQASNMTPESPELQKRDPASAQRAGKLVVLTGASGGIGLLVARRLLADGYRVIALCRSKPALESPDLVHVACDLGNEGSLAEAAHHLRREETVLHALIHCAGTITPSPVAEAQDDDLTAQIALNLTAPILLTRHLLPLLTSRGDGARGHIVFVNSMAAVMPLAGSAVYAASKAGLRSFALSLAQELRRSCITVSTVFPGAVQTDMLIREMQQGGSMLNYVSTPLDPDRVARSVAAQLRRPHAEIYLPAMDGIFGRLCMLAPCLLRLTLPVLGAAGRRGYRKAMAKISRTGDDRAV
ncbi:SDR family NAD(P)-dependent oxidoreductase [Asaia krungthepensis]|uniref:Short chain alcohol dehydrogenase n=1 Tax=Asaia krungthepensis NRIC 0535 TaxID=1307925 RepID=A0ABQ0Q3F4_9PROT|nr:SDR family oxidoreductase [Asaia krungthepensis]GBQ89545.1 short chain alcohol dehydrogenase [Asaia krungthepensis NRIC 0535]